MKKYLLCLAVLFFIIGCGEKKYIDATKNMKLEENEHFAQKNIESVEKLGIYYIHKLTGDNIKDIASNIQYSIAGDIGKDSKMVNMDYKGATVSVPVEKKGDLYSTKHLDIKGKFGKKKYTFKKFTQEVIDEKMNRAEEQYEKDLEKYIEDCKKLLK